MKLVLRRILDNGIETTGSLNVVGVNRKTLLSVCTLEPPFANNEVGKSCIPAGVYTVRKRWSLKFGYHFKILNVPNRSAILIHAGNFYKDTHGCIMVGYGFKLMNDDLERDLYDSKKALALLYKTLPEIFIIEIPI